MSTCTCHHQSATANQDYSIVFCPLHAAAPELLKALEGIYRVARASSLPGPVHLSIAEVDAAHVAIKAAKGDA